MLAKTLTALLMDSEPVGTKTNEEDECERKCTRFCVAKRRCVLRSNRGMSSSDFDKDLAYKFGEIMGIAFRVLYDLGENLFYKIKFTIIPSG